MTSPSLGKKEFQKGTNLLVEFVRDTDNCKNTMKLLKAKTGVSLCDFYLVVSLF